MLVLVSYLHYKMSVNLHLTNLLEAINCKEIIKIIKYLHLLFTSATVKVDAYHQTLTRASGS